MNGVIHEANTFLWLGYGLTWGVLITYGIALALRLQKYRKGGGK